jgi:hypothetical protein
MGTAWAAAITGDIAEVSISAPTDQENEGFMVGCVLIPWKPRLPASMAEADEDGSIWPPNGE